MYSSRFQKHPYDKSALSGFEVLTKPLIKCNEDCPIYATQYQVIFVQYQESFNFITSKASTDFKDQRITIPNGTPSITPHTKADIRNVYVITQESIVHRKSEKYDLIRKQNWFGAVQPNIPINAKLDYMVSRVLLDMDHTSLSTYI